MNDPLRQIAKHFRDDPVGYARIVLGVNLTADQEKILRLLTVPPHKVLVRAAHSVGKTFIAAVASNWYYDTRDQGLVLTTAPTERQVKSILWKEIRRLRGSWAGFNGPSSCLLQDAPDHFCLGFCARDDSRFQGHHNQGGVFVVMDEAVGVESWAWEAAETMLTHQLCIYNPTDQGSYASTAERSGNYHSVRLSALDHPNIRAELEGQPPPYPSAIRLNRLDELIRQWATPLEDSPTASDVEWPPGSGKWYRPGPVAECRLLGRWPTLASNVVWSESVFERAASMTLTDDGPVYIGCDPARFGDDNTCIHIRKGRVSVHHESVNGWSTSQTAARLRDLANAYGKKYDQRPERIAIMVDDTGVGGGVVDQANGYNFVPVNSAAKAYQPTLYPNRRSELWFDVADEAAQGNISFAGLPRQVIDDLRRELLSPVYTIDYQGRRVVEQKKDTKKRLGRSPDTADAVHLAYAKPKWDQTDTIEFKQPTMKAGHKFAV